MGQSWFRLGCEEETDSRIGERPKRSKTEVTANDSNFLIAANA